MSDDPFDVPPDAESLAEAEEFVRMYSAVNATEAAIYAEIVMARYDALTAVADAARALHTAQFSRPKTPEWSALGAALRVLEGEQ